jgi:hypothetical protein
MATFKIKFDLDKKEYTVEHPEELEVHAEIGDFNNRILYVLFGFTRGEQHPVEFNNLKFGYNLRDMDGNKLVNSVAYPIAGIKYMRSDAEILEHTRVSISEGKRYRLDIWVQENYKETKHNVWFDIPAISDYELDYIETHPEQPDYQEFLSMRNDELDTKTY